MLIVLILRVFNSNDKVEFIGLSPLKLIEIFSNEVNNTQLEELSIDDVINREKDNNLTAGANNKNIIPFNRISRGEAECKRVLEYMFNKEFKKVRPRFLKNPNTNRCLELDCFNEKLKLAIEYQGDQHYNWPNYTRQTFEDFRRQLWRDDFKVSECENNHIYLIRVSYEISLSNIQQYIYDNLPPDLQFIADQNMR